MKKAIWSLSPDANNLTDDEIKAAFVSAANKILSNRKSAIETFRTIKDTTFDTSPLEKEQDNLTLEINLVAGQIQDGIYKNAHIAQDQAEYEKSYEALTARYEKAKVQLERV